MSSAINQFYNQVDEGNTPYRSALALASKAIANDPDANSAEKPNYFVVLFERWFPDRLHGRLR